MISSSEPMFRTADQIFEKSGFWSGPYKVLFSVKDLKLSQWLDIGDMTSPSKYEDVT